MRTIVPLFVVLAFALLMQWVIGPFCGSYPTRIMLDTGIAIIMAVSLNIVNGYTGQFSIGHAAFMAIGAYVAGFITYYSSLKLWGDATPRPGIFGPHEWMLAGACIAGGLAAAGIGWIVGLPSLRLKGDYLAIVTLGFGEIMRVMLQQTNTQFYTAEDMKGAKFSELFLPPAVGGAQGFTDIPKVTNLFWMYLFVGLTVLFAYRLKQSSYGRAMLSIREDEIAAEAMGINVTKLKVRAFIFAAFFAGIAGALYAHETGNLLRPIDAGFQRSFDVIIMVVLGGLGSISGAVLAAIILTGLQSMLLGMAQYNLLEFRMPLFALLLILTMIFRPKGLFGIHEIWDCFPARKRKHG
ncbi:MAG TPA: branched-chain amino acid ABC transporter permease [Tepidisphaeraceae bacterium]|nr:branched-chain amino acid ABC transporter permease [Tepidisphaeraceae bacterium]